MLIETYVPKNFGKEYFEIKGPSQYPMFLAVALGVKPCFDDWIPVKKYEQFVELCKEYNLFVVSDVIFRDSKSKRHNIIGGNVNITTTFQEGFLFDKNAKEGNVHVFVSKSRKQALNAKQFGWYPVIINNRSMNKPFIDHLRFGKSLGFPDCCIDFFRKYNNWNIYSHPYEAFKNTRRIEGKAIGSYYCNNFLMDNIYFLIHNLPCSFRCNNTIKFAKELESRIFEVEPDFVKKTKRLLKKPLLVFGEKNFIIFDGFLKNNEIRYSNSEYFNNPARQDEKINFTESIIEGNRILLDNGTIQIFKNNTLLNEINKNNTWFMIDFD